MDERLINIQNQQQEAIDKSNSMYSGLLEDAKTQYDAQVDYLNEQEKVLNSNLDKQLENQTKKIEQQKEVAKQNYQTETKRALNDYSSFSNPYGNNAEAMAGSGLLQSGVSETSKLGGFNTYQNRLASANKTMQDAFTAYDNEINDARLNNDVAKAENALNKLNQALEYMQKYYSNKATITENQFNTNQALDSEYFNRYQTEYQNIKDEEATAEAIRQFEEQLAEEQRQYNANMAYQKERDKIADSQWQKEYDLAKGEAINISSSSKSSSSKTSSSGVDISDNNNQQTTEGTVKNPYTGTINKDAANGTFSNGYQPNNVDGNKLSNTTKLKVKDVFADSAYGYSGESLANQKIWSTSDGKHYVWDGSTDQYIDVTNEVNKSIKNSVCVKWMG